MDPGRRGRSTSPPGNSYWDWGAGVTAFPLEDSRGVSNGAHEGLANVQRQMADVEDRGIWFPKLWAGEGQA